MFPVLDNIKKMRDAIALVHSHIKVEPFYEKQDDTKRFAFFNYKFQSSYVFPPLESAPNDAIREALLITRECRGICFSLESGACVSRGFHKFFNVNEKPETLEANINLQEDHVILDKVDGSMIVAIFVADTVQEKPQPQQQADECSSQPQQQQQQQQAKKQGTIGTIRFRSKMGWNTDVSKVCEKFIYTNTSKSSSSLADNAASQFSEKDYPRFEQLPDGTLVHLPNYNSNNSNNNTQLSPLISFVSKWVGLGYSPIFEFVSPQTKIVLNYDETNLILLSMRHNITGNYYPFADMKADAQKHGLNIIRAWERNGSASTANLVKEISEMKNIEGFVLRFNDGRMFKIKCGWYVELHHVKNKNVPFKESDMWRLILGDKLDDVLSKCETQDLKQVFESFTTRLWKAIELAATNILKRGATLVQQANNLKEFINLVQQEQKNLQPMERTILFAFKSVYNNGSLTAQERVTQLPAREQIEDLLVEMVVKRLPRVDPPGWGKIPANIKEELVVLSGYARKEELELMLDLTPLIGPTNAGGEDDE